MTKLRKKRRARFPLTTMIPRLEKWLATPLGKAISSEEQHIIDDKVGELFGYHLLQLSVSRTVELSGQSTIRHRFSMTPLNYKPGVGNDSGAGHCGAVAEPSQLPLESDSIDVVMLHHVLEYSQTPHQLLREAARVTVPHGHLVIIGFNPWSLMGVWAMFAKLFPKTIWQNRYVSIMRLYDWLSLLDLSIVSVDYCFYKLPAKHGGLLNRLGFMERMGKKFHLPFGGCYIMVAKKETATLTPIRPRWFKKPSLVSNLEPSMYSHKVPKKSRLH